LDGREAVSFRLSSLIGGVSCPSAEERERIDGMAPTPGFEMQVGASRISGLSHLGNRFSPLDTITRTNQQLAGVGIKSRQSLSVVNQDHFPVPFLFPCPNDLSRGRRSYLLT
jgi:hypothetical protein